ncbi:sirohydrochlorin cobaltochelatase [Plebeiibacterium marinum]|uniref:Sirohydrochlorin cobaltochelatase n=1 Tax=Plebeiibacterium marinum TaxID=2992111 RepID=A0AAE3SKS5_9BACT|nr:sirohydrochlorin cobaltochelatase [Plebeiobacterium marinum]MCW3807170.1 sirohydrochlorin cobaltochelatase [Plebeiobacterium marinum]
MKFIYTITFLLLLLPIAIDNDLNAEKMEKKGILLVTFGSSYPEAQAAFDNIEKLTHETFPNTPVYWAYTSKFIRRKLAKNGKTVYSPSQALAHMSAEGYTHIAVQSLHVIPGKEYDDLKKTVEAFANIPEGASKISLGGPLLHKHNDNVQLAQALAFNKELTPQKNEALVYMGHGTSHIANIYYPGFEYYLQQHNNHCYMGTVEGYPELNDVILKLKKNHINKLLLSPFMTVCGDHVQNDMAGDKPESWKSILESHGFKVRIILKGIAEYDDVVKIWINHLKEAWDELDN